MIEPIGQCQRPIIAPLSIGNTSFSDQRWNSFLSKGKSEGSFFEYVFDYFFSLWRLLTSFFCSTKSVSKCDSIDLFNVSDERKILLENILNDFDPKESSLFQSPKLDRKIKLNALHCLYCFLKQVDTLIQDKNSHEYRAWITIMHAPQTDYTIHYDSKTDPKELAKQLIECLEKEFNKNQNEPFSFILNAQCNRLLYSPLGGPIWLDKYCQQASISENDPIFTQSNWSNEKNKKFYSYQNALKAFASNENIVGGETHGQS